MDHCLVEVVGGYLVHKLWKHRPFDIRKYSYSIPLQISYGAGQINAELSCRQPDRPGLERTGSRLKARLHTGERRGEVECWGKEREGGEVRAGEGELLTRRLVWPHWIREDGRKAK